MNKNGFTASLHKTLFAILLLAALLRLWGLGRGDVLGDEGSYAFRAIGMLDFDEASLQTTPVEWFDPDSPWWLSLSFHDHPPLVFFVQHVFMNIFGETNFGFRLPSALLGIASVYLLYKIGEILYGRQIGLVAAALLAVTVNHVHISRLGLQEAYVIFFILLAAYFFLQGLHQSRENRFLFAGIALGLGILTKYTTVVIAPILGTYLLATNYEQIFNKKLWLGLLLAMLVASPIIVYNLMLYQTRGHFDFQLSFIFHQYPEVWKVTPGKEIGTIAERIRAFPAGTLASNSWILITLAALSVVSFFVGIIALIKNSGTVAMCKKHFFLILSFIFLSLLILFIGPAPRFLSYYSPFISLAVGYLIVYTYERWLKNWQRISLACFAILFLFEVFYTYNSVIRYYPWNEKPWTYSSIRYENYNWGYNALGKYLDHELADKMPAFTFQSKYKFIERLQEASIARDKKRGRAGYAALIVYDRNIFNTSQLWLLDRLQIYHGWPVLATDAYQAALSAQGPDYFQKIGLKTTYFIRPSDSILLKSPELRSPTGALLEREVRAHSIAPVILTDPKNEEVFLVYKF